MTEDQLFRQRDGSEPFRFDASVASVFPDMLKRSIPGYSASIEAIGSLAARFVEPGTRCYDLGCSPGAASIAMRQGAAGKKAPQAPALQRSANYACGACSSFSQT